MQSRPHEAGILAAGFSTSFNMLIHPVTIPQTLRFAYTPASGPAPLENALENAAPSCLPRSVPVSAGEKSTWRKFNTRTCSPALGGGGEGISEPQSKREGHSPAPCFPPPFALWPGAHPQGTLRKTLVVTPDWKDSPRPSPGPFSFAPALHSFSAATRWDQGLKSPGPHQGRLKGHRGKARLRPLTAASSHVP